MNLPKNHSGVRVRFLLCIVLCWLSFCATTSAQCTFPDNTKPIVRVRKPFTIKLDSVTNTFTLRASMLDSLSSDNCTPHDSLKFGITGETFFQFSNPAIPFPSADTLVLTCTGLKLFRLFAQDKAGNKSLEEIFIEVEPSPNVSQCVYGGYEEQPTFAGSIKNEQGMNVAADVAIIPYGFNLPITVFKNKNIFYGEWFSGGDYYIVASKKDNPKNGVSTFDLVLLQRHILGIQLLNSPYKYIAADVNNSKTITTADIVYLRKVILGIVDTFANGRSWEFVPKKFTFTDPNKPLLSFDNTSHRIFMANVKKDTLGLDFIAIKKGDLNNSAVTQAAPRTATSYLLEVPNPSFEAHQRIEIPVTTLGNTSIEGYQGTFNYDPNTLELLEIIGKNDNFSIQKEGKIAFSELRQPQQQEQLFTLVFQTKRRGNVTQNLFLSDAITRSEAYTLEGEAQPLALKYKNDLNTETFTLFPNPANQTVTVFFPKREVPATITIYNNLGQLVYSKIDFEASSINVMTWADGMYFCRIQQGEKEEIKKLVITR
jgi:hypothetical protein